MSGGARKLASLDQQPTDATNMKTRKLYTIRAAGRTVGRRLRCAAHAARALRTCKRLGVDAYKAPVSINSAEFDAFGRRIPKPAPVIDCRTGLPVAA